MNRLQRLLYRLNIWRRHKELQARFDAGIEEYWRVHGLPIKPRESLTIGDVSILNRNKTNTIYVGYVEESPTSKPEVGDLGQL